MTWRAFLPIGIFLALAVALFLGLNRNPARVPSPMIGKPAPTFALPALDTKTQGFSSAELTQGKISVVNVFASWCIPCRQESAQLLALSKRKDITLYGIDYKDSPAKARAFLDEGGDPYAAIGADRSGRVSIDWGVYGVPETYIVDGKGKILFKQVGPISDDDLSAKITPFLDKLGS